MQQLHARPYTTMQSQLHSPLNLETPRPSPTTSTLKLPSLARNVRLLVLVRAETEVLDCLASVLGAAQEDGVRAGRSTHGELVEGEALAAGFLDAGAGCAGEAQGGDGELGDFKETGSC